MAQLGIPVAVDLDAIKRKKTFGASIKECMELGGVDPKQLPFDKAQISRWESDSEGVKWDRLQLLMDAAGNDAPIFWMLHQRGYDLHSVRRLESPVEAENRLLREEVAALRRVLKVQL